MGGLSRVRDPDQAAFLWAVAFLHAANDARVPGRGPEEHLHSEMAAAHALLDLRNVLRAVRWGLRDVPDDHPVHAHIEAFHLRFPGVLEARDALEHFDEYAEARGRRQRGRGTSAPWLFDVERVFTKGGDVERVVVRVGPHTLDLTALAPHVVELVGRVAAATDPAPTEGNVYAEWFRAQGHPLLPAATEEEEMQRSQGGPS